MLTTVVDANLCVACVLPVDYSTAAVAKLTEWTDQAHALCAPTLWSYELTSTLRQFQAAGMVDSATAERKLAQLLALGINEVSPTPERHRRALLWAERLDQRVAYDGAYLALAEDLHAEFWTADRRCFERARAAGATWVHLVSAST